MRKLLLLIIPLVFLAGCIPGGSQYEITEILVDGQDIIFVGDEWEDAGCIFDAKHVGNGEDIYETVYSDNTVDTSESGVYTVEYQTVIESDALTCTRNVIVMENEVPVVTLKPGIDTVVRGQFHIDQGIWATDNQEEELFIYVENNVDTSRRDGRREARRSRPRSDRLGRPRASCPG